MTTPNLTCRCLLLAGSLSEDDVRPDKLDVVGLVHYSWLAMLDLLTGFRTWRRGRIRSGTHLSSAANDCERTWHYPYRRSSRTQVGAHSGPCQVLDQTNMEQDRDGRLPASQAGPIDDTISAQRGPGFWRGSGCARARALGSDRRWSILGQLDSVMVVVG
jgi:hypothetical protein